MNVIDKHIDHTSAVPVITQTSNYEWKAQKYEIKSKVFVSAIYNI